MKEVLAALDHPDYSTSVWFLPVAYALHELEEWNILGWHQRNYIDLPPPTDRTIRTFLMFATVVGFVWTAVAAIPGRPAGGRVRPAPCGGDCLPERASARLLVRLFQGIRARGRRLGSAPDPHNLLPGGQGGSAGLRVPLVRGRMGGADHTRSSPNGEGWQQADAPVPCDLQLQCCPFKTAL